MIIHELFEVKLKETQKMPVIEKYRHKREHNLKIGVLLAFRVAYRPHCVYDYFGVQEDILERMTHGCQRREIKRKKY